MVHWVLKIIQYYDIVCEFNVFIVMYVRIYNIRVYIIYIYIYIYIYIILYLALL